MYIHFNVGEGLMLRVNLVRVWWFWLDCSKTAGRVSTLSYTNLNWPDTTLLHPNTINLMTVILSLDTFHKNELTCSSWVYLVVTLRTAGTSDISSLQPGSNRVLSPVISGISSHQSPIYIINIIIEMDLSPILQRLLSSSYSENHKCTF